MGCFEGNRNEKAPHSGEALGRSDSFSLLHRMVVERSAVVNSQMRFLNILLCMYIAIIDPIAPPVPIATMLAIAKPVEAT